MNKRHAYRIFALFHVLGAFFITFHGFGGHVLADEARSVIRFSSSAQVFEAMGPDLLKQFQTTSGIQVADHITSSNLALTRLMHDYCDIAAIADRLSFDLKQKGYVEIPFCEDPLAVIVNSGTGIANLSLSQLRDIFRARIRNWKEVGGADQAIVLVIPGKNTAAFQNFQKLLMKFDEIEYDLMTWRSTMAIETVKYMPGAISFISRGAAAARTGIGIVRVDGKPPEDDAYPFHQTFSFVTKGSPEGVKKDFINFYLSTNK